MIRNYFKITYRTLKASKAYTLINVLGLAVGISAFILMTTYVHHELSFDKFHENGDRIYRLSYEYVARGEDRHVSKVAFPFKKMILESYPQVERIVRFYQNRMDISTLRYESQVHTEKQVFFADPEVLEVFNFELEQGDPATALKEARSIVLTRKAAAKYFGNENPMGKTLEYKEGEALTVTGILKEVPSTSHIQFDILLPVELQRQRWIRGQGNNGYDLEEDWRWSGAWTYILLKSSEQTTSFLDSFNQAGKDYFGRLKGRDITYIYRLTPLEEIYFQSSIISLIGETGNIDRVYAFSAISFLVLVIACINFINLSTARATKRAKEVGLRKVMGAVKHNLIGQFLTESLVICSVAAIMAIVLVEVILPFFNHFIGKTLSIPYWQQPELWLYFLLGIGTIGFLSGLYPAFYLSSFVPSKTLKGNYEDGRNGQMRLRKSLVLGQFIVSNLLIIGIIVMHKQLDYIKNKDLGFDKDKTIVLTHGSKIDKEFSLFASRIKTIPNVAKVNQGYVAGERGWQQSFEVDGEVTHEGKSLGHKMISFDFVDMYGLEIIAGRNFDRSFGTDSTGSALLNEAAIKIFGWTPEEALGKEFGYVGGNDNKTRYRLKVVGVLRDANFESLYDPVRPSVFQLRFSGDIAIKFNATTRDQLFSAIEEVEKEWESIASEWPFEFKFLDQQIAEQYRKDNLLSDMISYFGVLAILIAGLGLFGLASFTVQRRTKEIGVRKVMGATVQGILLLISKGFLILVMISFIISIPIGYYLSDAWLSEFTFRIGLSPWIFAISGFLSFLIGMFAVCFQSTKAALLDPVKTLRYE